MTMERAPRQTGSVLRRIWVHSDLQTADATLARHLLEQALDDWRRVEVSFDEIWCLGDEVHGPRLDVQEATAEAVMSVLSSTGLPVSYVMGNHEMDLKRQGGLDRYPLRELALHRTGWHIGTDLAQPGFTRALGPWLVVFLGDCAAPDGSWWSSHGHRHGKADTIAEREAFEVLRREMAAHPGPVIIASHYSLPGGQRPAENLRWLLPLPANVCFGLYGHAHIGDLIYNAEFPWRRENPVEGSAVRQFNVSALETRRSPGSHSALLEILHDEGCRLRFRCHQERRWLEAFAIPRPSAIGNPPGAAVAAPARFALPIPADQRQTPRKPFA